MQQFRAWVTGVCLALVLGMGGAVQAASLQLSPTSLSLPAGQRAGALVLRNTGRAPVTAQIRAFSWQQDAQGKDVLTPTAALIVSPPMVRLDAGAEQQFRVIRAQAAAGGEQAYRLWIDELPPPGAAPGKGIQFLLRHSVPVFLNSEENPDARLRWRVMASDKGGAELEVRNEGPVHAQLSIMRVQPRAGGRDIPISNGLFAYVLPGHVIRRPLPVSLQALRQGQFIAVVNAHETRPPLEFVP